MKIYRNVLEMVGSTPLLELQKLDAGPCRLFAKLELLNPGGSIKDRIGVAMIEAGESGRAEGRATPSSKRRRATPGIGLALAAARRATACVLVIPDKMSQEKIFNLRSMGAEIILTRSDVARRSSEYYQDLARQLRPRARRRTTSTSSAIPTIRSAHETTTAPEIWEQMDHDLDAVVVGVSTSEQRSRGLSGLLPDGVAPKVEIVLADPRGSSARGITCAPATLTQKARGSVEGIGGGLRAEHRRRPRRR